jgi:hypothetical protein
MNIWNWLFGSKKKSTTVPLAVLVRTVAVVVPNGIMAQVTMVSQTPNVPVGVTGKTNIDGYVAWNNIPAAMDSAEVTVEADGYVTIKQIMSVAPGNVNLTTSALQLIPVVVPEPVPPVNTYEIPEALYVDGRIFRKKSNNAAWRYKLVSAFYNLQRWDRGEDLSAWVKWTHAVGGNGWRVFCQFKFANGTDPLKPGQISAARIAEFVKWAMTQGMYIELTVLTDTQGDGFNMTLDEEVARVKAVLAAVAGLPCFVEIKNEPFKNGERVKEICDVLGLRSKSNRPVLMATGDYNIVGNESGFFALDYIGDHPERKVDWSAEAGKTGHFVYDGWAKDDNSPGFVGFRSQNVAVLSGEPVGAAEIDQPGRRDANPNHWEEAGGGFGMGGSGGCGHTDAGSIGNSAGHAPHGAAPLEVPGPVQTTCITAFFKGMDFFPVDAFSGDYAHDGFGNHPVQSSGAYGECTSRVFGNRAYAVAAMPTDKWVPVPVNGWRIVKQAGWRNELVELAR